MSDLISRQAAIEVLEWFDQTDPLGHTPGQIVRALPTAEPRKGKWKRAYLDHEAMGERPSILYCSVCNQCIAYPVNYCPNCGARMEESE